MRELSRLLVLSLLLVLLVGCGATYDSQSDLAALDAKIEEFSSLVSAGDVDGIMGQYASEVEPEAYMLYANVKGRDAIRAAWEALFANAEVTGLTIVDRHHKLDRNLAVSYGLWKMTLKSGEIEQQLEGRFTNVLGKKTGRWQLLHVHLSTLLSPVPAPMPPAVPEA